MKLTITKKVELEYLGENWKDCYIEFRSPTYADIKDIQGNEDQILDKGIGKAKDLFVKGIVLTDNGIYEMKSEDIEQLPIEIITKCFETITGQLEKK